MSPLGLNSFFVKIVLAGLLSYPVGAKASSSKPTIKFDETPPSLLPSKVEFAYCKLFANALEDAPNDYALRKLSQLENDYLAHVENYKKARSAATFGLVKLDEASAALTTQTQKNLNSMNAGETLIASQRVLNISNVARQNFDECFEISNKTISPGLNVGVRGGLDELHKNYLFPKYREKIASQESAGADTQPMGMERLNTLRDACDAEVKKHYSKPDEKDKYEGSIQRALDSNSRLSDFCSQQKGVADQVANGARQIESAASNILRQKPASAPMVGSGQNPSMQPNSAPNTESDESDGIGWGTVAIGAAVVGGVGYAVGRNNPKSKFKNKPKPPQQTIPAIKEEEKDNIPPINSPCPEGLIVTPEGFCALPTP